MNRAALRIALIVILLLGAAGWIFSLFNDSLRAFLALLVNFAFFAPLSAGLVVWPAAVIASNGRWMGGVEKTARTAIAFSGPSLVILVVLWISCPEWAPWVKDNTGHDVWLNSAFVFIRNIVLLAIFWAIAVVFLRKRLTEKGKLWAGILCFAYCVAFTFVGFDLIMTLEIGWKSQLFGAYFFISGLYIAIAAWALLTIMYKDYDEKRLMDMGKLIVTFCLMTTYMMYSQLLPLWYENIPDETKFIVPRSNFAPWAAISLIISIVIYVSPLVLLLTKWSKRTPWFLAAVSLLVLIGMWMERWWLVSVRFNPSASFGLAEIAGILLFLGLFGLLYDGFYSSHYLEKFGKAKNER